MTSNNKTGQISDSLEMAVGVASSAELMELVQFAEREDRLYQAELRLAEEFSRVALAFAEATPEAEVICRDYIGTDSVLRHRARSSLLRSISSIEKALDKFQGLTKKHKLDQSLPDYFGPKNPANAFLESEIRRRDLDSFLGRCI